MNSSGSPAVSASIPNVFASRLRISSSGIRSFGQRGIDRKTDMKFLSIFIRAIVCLSRVTCALADQSRAGETDFTHEVRNTSIQRIDGRQGTTLRIKVQ